MNITSFITHWRIEIMALTFSAFGIYKRISVMATRMISPDEASSLHDASGPLRAFWEYKGHGEMTPFPGDYLLKWPVIQLFGTENKWLIHIPNYFIVGLGFWFFYKICKRNLKSSIAICIAFILMTFNYNLIFHAFEFRPYPGLVLIALISFYYCDRLVMDFHQVRSLHRWLIILLFAFFTVYHPYGIMIIIACLTFFFIKQRWSQSFIQTFKETSSFCVPFLLCCIPLFLYYATGTTFTKETSIARGIGVFDFIPNPMESPTGFIKSMLGNLLAVPLYNAKFLFISLLIAPWIPNKDRWLQGIFFMVLIVLPITAILLSDISKSYWFLQRQFVWSMPLFALLIAWCWDSIIAWIRKDMLKQSV